MSLKHIPHSSGVYEIKCITNQKIYIGSSVNMHERIEHHRSDLRKDKHINPHLQSAWNKHGEESFEFTVLQLTEIENLLLVEKYWLDKTKSYKRENGYNVYSEAGSPGDANAQIWEGFIDPQGNEVTITNLFDLCRRNNLDFPSMHRLAKGESKLKSYKGWSHKNSVRQRDYVKTYDGFIDPQANPVGPITNLAAFCRENNLDNTHMVAVANGRIYSHRGWTYQNEREDLSFKKYTGFISPEGQRVVISNLTNFCRENNLTAVHMYELINGKRKSHKGWRWESSNE